MALTVAAYVAGWAVVAVPVALHDFRDSSRQTVIAGHDAVVSPTFDSYITLDLGAYLPNLRYPSNRRLGVNVVVGKTNLDSYQSLLQRYALIASRPEGEVSKVSGLVKEMLIGSIAQGAVFGLVGPAAWLLLGARRRAELRQGISVRRVALTAAGVAGALAITTAAPWSGPPEAHVAASTWEPIGSLVPGTQLPQEAEGVQVQGGLLTTGTQQLIQSALRSYDTSNTYYQDIADRVPRLRRQLRQPEPGDTVALLVTDRHDNVGMDPVARAIADAGGATVLFDAGDDTSTGEPWETFSLDSLAEAFDDFGQKFQVPGNHDEGAFVGDYLDDKGFTVLSGEALTTEDGIRLLGVADPRSSGLGNWRTDGPVTFEEQTTLLGDAACRSDAEGKRIATLLVHDAALGDAALERGCVDLVLGGHLHIQVGPDVVEAKDGRLGVRYTNGTTGGAAYAVAVGTKLRRDAEVTFITYRDGHPVGLQPVWVRTTGEFDVRPFWPIPAAVTDGTGDGVAVR